MNIEVIPIAQLPEDSRIAERHQAIYRAARQLKRMGDSAAIRVSLDDEANVHELQKRAHKHFRSSVRKLRTRRMGAYLYMWMEGEL